jgi:hypothetical protein
MPNKKDRPKTIEPEHVASRAANSDEPVIRTIPDKFYGAALKARISEPEEHEVPKDKGKKSPAAAAPRKGMGAGTVIIVVFVIVLAAGAGFAYFNRGLLFPSPAAEEPMVSPEPPAPPPPPPPPSAPTNASATATSPSVVRLEWTDASNNEAGFRVERRETATEYRSITSLPPNSSVFQDGSVEPERTYLYRVIALNEGGESPASNEASVTVPPEPPPPPEPPTLPPAGLDSDSDGLTDLEEPLYGTSSRDPDADKDTFLDGNEVFHLYNPAGGASVRLLESGLVKPFESAMGWKVFVPTTWKAELSADGMRGTITTGHGETFSIFMEENPEGLELLAWYLGSNPGTLSSQVASITTKSGIAGIEGADLLTTYFSWNNHVLVFRYDLNDQPFVNFRQTYEMMKNSLYLTPSPNVPEPEPEPMPVPEEPIPAPFEGVQE